METGGTLFLCYYITMKENEMKKEQFRITLAITFVATYLTLIFSLVKLFNFAILKTWPHWISVACSFVYIIFVVFGVLVALTFLLYLFFVAISLTSEFVFFDMLIISKSRAKKIKNTLFDLGVELIFVSITIVPIGMLGGIIADSYIFPWLFSK